MGDLLSSGEWKERLGAIGLSIFPRKDGEQVGATN